MSSNIDSEIIKNLRSSGNQNTLAQSSFSSMVLNGTEIKGANNTVTKNTKYSRSKPQNKIKSVYSDAVILCVLENGDLYVAGNQEAQLVYSVGLPFNQFITHIANYGDSWLITGRIYTDSPLLKYFTVASDGSIKNIEFTLPLAFTGGIPPSPDGISTGGGVSWGMSFFLWSAIGDYENNIFRTCLIDLINSNLPSFTTVNQGESATINTVNYGLIPVANNVFFTGEDSYIAASTIGIEFEESIIHYNDTDYEVGVGFPNFYADNIFNETIYRWFVEFEDTIPKKEGFIQSQQTTFEDLIENQDVNTDVVETTIPYFGLTDDTKNWITSISVYINK
jgi:hypothetical protein